MAEIFDAYRFVVASGEAKLHRGTKVYLESIRATLIDKSGREVPDHHVDEQGKYRFKEPEADRT